MRGFGTPLRTQPSQGGPQLWGQRCHRSPSRGRAAALGSHRAAAGSSSPTSQEHTHTKKKSTHSKQREKSWLSEAINEPAALSERVPVLAAKPWPGSSPANSVLPPKISPSSEIRMGRGGREVQHAWGCSQGRLQDLCVQDAGGFLGCQIPKLHRDIPALLFEAKSLLSPSPPSPSRSTQGEKILLARRGRTRAGEGAAAFVPPKFVPSARAG